MTVPASLPLVLIEAFAAAPHQGNGATVVALEAPASATWMQAVAGTLRQSETAFVLPWGDAWAIRWFTPSCEVNLCGHATLAATLALGHWGIPATWGVHGVPQPLRSPGGEPADP